MKVFVFFISNSENMYITDLVFIGRVNETEVNIIHWGSTVVPTKDYLAVS
jgi:hypothetical protein